MSSFEASVSADARADVESADREADRSNGTRAKHFPTRPGSAGSLSGPAPRRPQHGQLVHGIRLFSDECFVAGKAMGRHERRGGTVKERSVRIVPWQWSKAETVLHGQASLVLSWLDRAIYQLSGDRALRSAVRTISTGRTSRAGQMATVSSPAPGRSEAGRSRRVRSARCGCRAGRRVD